MKEYPYVVRTRKTEDQQFLIDAAKWINENTDQLLIAETYKHTRINESVKYSGVFSFANKNHAILFKLIFG